MEDSHASTAEIVLECQTPAANSKTDSVAQFAAVSFYLFICFQSQMPRRTRSIINTSHIMLMKIPAPPLIMPW